MSRNGQLIEWSAHEVAIIRLLWQTGITAAGIANRLGTTRNSVIGKARRLGLAPRPSPIKPRPDGFKPRVRRVLVDVSSNSAAAGWTSPGCAVSLPRPSAAERGEQAALALQSSGTSLQTVGAAPLLQAGGRPAPFRSCQWITSVGRPWVFCIEGQARGPYCAAHAAMAYRRLKECAA